MANELVTADSKKFGAGHVTRGVKSGTLSDLRLSRAVVRFGGFGDLNVNLKVDLNLHSRLVSGQPQIPILEFH